MARLRISCRKNSTSCRNLPELLLIVEQKIGIIYKRIQKGTMEQMKTAAMVSFAF